MACNREEVDEDRPAQEIIDFVFPRRVPPHQALQGGRFVRSKMVDMQIGKSGQSIGYEIYEAFERRPLLLPSGGPVAHVALRAVRILVKIPKEKFQSAISDNRIALEIEQDVARR